MKRASLMPILIAGVYAVLWAAPKPRGEMSITLEDGRVAVLNPDSTYRFKDGSVIPEDSCAISMLLRDGRTILLKPDGTWQIGRNLKPEPSKVVPMSLEPISVTATIDKGSVGRSEEAARTSVIDKAVDKISARIKHPKVTRKLVAACLKHAIPPQTVVTRIATNTSVTAELTLELMDLKRIKECLEDQIAMPPDTTTATKTPSPTQQNQ